MIRTNVLISEVRQEESCHSLEEIISILQRVKELLKAYVIRTNFLISEVRQGESCHSLEEIISTLQRVEELL